MTFRTWLRTSTTRFADRKPRRTRRRKFAIELLEDRRLLSGWTLALPGDASTPFNRTPDAWDQKVDVSGNVYVTGAFYGTINFDPKHPSSPTNLTNVGDNDAFLAKYTPAGDLAWVRALSGDSIERGSAIALDSSGNVYLSGKIFSGSASATFRTPTGPTGPTLPQVGQSENFFVAKLNAAGDVLWAQRMSGSFSGAGLAVDAGGSNVWVTGDFSGTTSFGPTTLTSAGQNDVFVTRLDASSGAVQWAGQLGGTSYDGESSLAIDRGGNVYLTGGFSETADLNPGPGVFNLNSAGSGDIFLTKLDPAGGFLWAKGVGGASSDRVFQVAAVATGNGDFVYLQAYMDGGIVDFDPGTGVTNVSGISAVAKYTSDGALIWASGFAGYINGFDFDTSGNIYTTGRFWGTVDFDLGPSVFNMTSAGIADRPYSDAYLSKWNSSGNLTWVRRMGGSDFDVTHSVAVDAAGNVYVTGAYNDRGPIGDFGVSGSSDFPTGDTLTGRGGAFAMKLEQLPNGQLNVATISGTVFHDVNGDGVNNEGSTVPPPAPIVYIDLNQNGALDPNEPSTTPYLSGHYSLNGLAAGTYQVRQLVPSGWTLTAPSAGFHVVTVDFTTGSDQLFLAKDFGNLIPTKFYVVNDAATDWTYEYGNAGSSIENYSLNSANTAPRGAASTAAGDRVWVVDANRKVYVYNPSGGLLAAWTAGNLPNNATLDGIATNGTDVWIVDSRSDRVYKYTGGASYASGTGGASSSFALNSGNKNPKDIVTDGVHLWVVEDSTTDKVFKYTVAGALIGSWTISTSGAGSPTGITIDPSNVSDIWIVDNAADKVFHYPAAASRTSGSQAAVSSFVLAAGNTNPQGIADPPPPVAVQRDTIAAAASSQVDAIDFAMGKLLDDSVRLEPSRTFEIDRTERSQLRTQPMPTHRPVEFLVHAKQPVSSERQGLPQAKRLARSTDDFFSTWNSDELEAFDV